MIAAFLLPGYSPDLTFDSSSLDLLRQEMVAHNIQLNGVTDSWRNHGILSFGQRAVEQTRLFAYDGILIGHSLGALAALSVVDKMPIRHLLLCSPSALFSEDIDLHPNPEVNKRIGEQRVAELRQFSANKAVSSVNRLKLPTTILFGGLERSVSPNLVARSDELASMLDDAKLIEVAGAGHRIGENPYAYELARIVGDIANRLAITSA